MVTSRSGQDVDAPSAIPVRAWLQVWKRTLRRAFDDGLLTEAAGVAFYAVFAFFAGLAALVSVWGRVADPALLGQRVREVERALPAGLPELLHGFIANAGLGQGAAAFAAALWAASGAAGALLRGLNLAYCERECRGFWRFNALSLLVMFCGIAFTLVALAAFLLLPSLAEGMSAAPLIRALRWPALLVVAGAGLAALYRIGPCRAEPRWRWVSWGGCLAALAWVAGSAGFSWYVRNFGGYGAAYGPFAAVVVFMTWAWLSASAVLMGALLNAEVERQTVRGGAAAREDPAEAGHDALARRGGTGPHGTRG